MVCLRTISSSIFFTAVLSTGYQALAKPQALDQLANAPDPLVFFSHEDGHRNTLWQDSRELGLSESLAAFPLWQSPDLMVGKVREKKGGGGLIKMIAHSPSQMEVTPGNRVQLEVKLKEEPDLSDSFLWTRNDKILCRTPQCLIATRGWGVGDHRIHVQISRGDQIAEYVFKLKLRFEHGDKKAQLLTPDLVPVSLDPHRIVSAKAFIQAVRGRGYARRLGVVNSVDLMAHALYFDEHLRTLADSVLQFGGIGESVFYLMPRSAAHLYSAKDGRKGIRLLYGAIRMRNLSAQRYWRWNLMFGDLKGVQLIGSPDADIFVNMRPPSLRPRRQISCLRGVCKLAIPDDFLKKPKDQRQLKFFGREQDGYWLFHLLAGQTLMLDGGPRSFFWPELSSPSPSGLDQMYELTTPIDQGDQKKQISDGPSAENNGLHLIGGGFADKGSMLANGEASSSFQGEKSLKRVAVAWQERDLLWAVQQLQAFPTSYKSDARFALVLGKMYLYLHHYGAAMKQLEQAVKSTRTRDRAYFYLGLCRLLRHEEDAALEAFSKVKQFDRKRMKRLEYYRGVAAFHLGEERSSKEAFELSLWDIQEKALLHSARDYLELLRRRKAWELELMSGLYADTNLFHSNKDNLEISEQGATEVSGRAAWLKVHLAGVWANTPGIELKYGTDLEYHAVNGPVLQEAGPSEVKMFAALKAHIGHVKEPTSRVQVSPFIHRLGRGSRAAVDGYGLNLHFEWLESWFLPGIFYSNRQYFDPKPESFKGIDPLSVEPAGVHDLGAHIVVYGLSAWLRSREHQKAQVNLQWVDHRKSGAGYVYASYTGLRLVGDYEQRFSPQWGVTGSFRYEGRQFTQSALGRSDTLLEAKGRGAWYISPSEACGLSLSYLVNQSSLSEWGYAKFVYGLDYGFAL